MGPYTEKKRKDSTQRQTQDRDKKKKVVEMERRKWKMGFEKISRPMTNIEKAGQKGFRTYIFLREIQQRNMKRDK